MQWRENNKSEKLKTGQMMGVRRRLACCTRDREISIDFDKNEPNRIVTYDGLESCILNSQSYRVNSNINREDGYATDEEETSCSSSKDAFGSFFSDWTTKRETEETDEWSGTESPQHFYVKEKPAYATQFSDVEAMKEKFAKLLLGEDVTGGCKGITSALAISNAITNLAASVFGELWKLEPLPEDKKAKWRKEMDWLLSPTSYMVELVPALQTSSNGRSFEIMTPKARADVHMNLPALQKIDSMLIEALDSVVGTEFWYEEGNSRREGREGSERQSKRWWLPCPQVPVGGLSETARKKLLSQVNVVQQVFKAAKSINDNVLSDMPIPNVIQDALSKSGREALGEDLYRILASGTKSAAEMADLLKLRSEHEALDTINKLEAAALAWKQSIKEQVTNNSNKTSVRTSWSFMKETISEVERTETLLFHVDALLYQLKMRYPCLPHTFIDATKIQYGKDVGHSILEAYSRVLGNLAYRILSRIGDILQEDHTSNPNTPMPVCCFPFGFSPNVISGSPIVNPRIRHSLVDRMNKADAYFSDSNPARSSDSEISYSTEANSSSVTATPSSGRIWCIGKDACNHGSPDCSP